MIYAVLCVLARLGLRGAEAAGLQLDDIDWRAGEIDDPRQRATGSNGSRCRWRSVTRWRLG